jgi:hypothetical protein
MKEILGKAGEKLIENLVNDLYEISKLAIGDQIKKWSINRSVRKLSSQVNKIRQVKTLWQVDKAVDLTDFYCDSHVYIEKQRIKISFVSDFGEMHRILITGIAGQGKSILLRFLCSIEFIRGEKLPIFIELRKIFSNEKLFDHIRQFIEDVGIPEVNDKLLQTLLSSGRIILFLDGFDEISENEKQRVLREIERLGFHYDNLQIIVTSRPESGLEVLPLFNVVKLSDLKDNEYKAVIRKLSDDPLFADNLIRQVDSHKSKLNDLLCTPLLVTLLVMTYKSFQELPEQLSDFYDSIFQILLQRHDGAKPGYRRPRRCKLNDNQYRSIFESFCFESKRKVKSNFQYDDILEFAKSAITKNKITVDETKYIEDIIKVTCLVLHEGNDYRFIHKSVQEYYAAAFIKHRSEPVAKRFYEQMIVVGLYSQWNQELSFLKEIDKYRFVKYFYLPYSSEILSCKPESIPEKPPKVNLNIAKVIFKDINVGLESSKNSRIVFVEYNKYTSHRLSNRIFGLDFSSVVNAIKKKKFTVKNTIKSPIQNAEHDVYFISVENILENGLMLNNLFLMAQEIVNEIHTEAIQAREIVLKEESYDLTFDIEY